MEGQELRDYLNGLKEGERVVETGQSGIHGRKGTVYWPEDGPSRGPCVRWDNIDDPDGPRMGTSATGGTRRVSDTKEN